MEAFWEDSFTGIAHCRARWIVRASEVPDRDVSLSVPVSEDEVLLTTVANDIEATNILGLAPVASAPPAADVKPEPEPSSSEGVILESAAAAAAGTRRVLRPKTCSSRRGGAVGRAKRSKTSPLYLRRSFDPFTAVASALPTDHPVLVQLRERERERCGSSGRERARGRWSSSRWGGGVGALSKSSDGDGRVGVERKGLRGARLVLAAPRQRSGSRSSDGSSGGGGGGGYSSSSSSSMSVSVGGESDNSSSISDGGLTSEDSRDDLLDEDDDDNVVAVASTGYPRTRRGRPCGSSQRAAAAASSTKAPKRTKRGRPRKAEAAAAATAAAAAAAAPETTSLAVSLPARPRRLAMPPDDSPLVDLDPDSDGSGSGSAHAAGASAGGRKSLLRGGPLIRAAHAGDDAADGLESPNVEQYPQKETGIGEDHQVDIPDMLTTEGGRAADREAIGAGEMGGTLVSLSFFLPLVVSSQLCRGRKASLRVACGRRGAATGTRMCHFNDA